jgi:hypothetical protein
MHRLLVLLVLPAVFVFSCSGEGKCPSGSECSLLDCACTDVYCDYYSQTTTKDIRITYKNGAESIAVIAIQTDEISPIEGHVFAGDDLQYVTLDTSVNNWIQFNNDSHCKIYEYGGVDKQLKGSCTFIFDHGNGQYNAHMPFNCTLEPVEL